jgi:tetratricopeptide (TPR) repeat protein
MAASSSTGHAPVRIPRLVRDTLYAPQCPNEHVAGLVDVALTHHNAGRYEQALPSYHAARSAWEDALIGTALSDGGLTAIAAEAAVKPWLLTGDPDPAAVAAAEAKRLARTQRRAARLVAAADQSTTAASKPVAASNSKRDEKGKQPKAADDDSTDGEIDVSAITMDPMAAINRERQLEDLRKVLGRRAAVIPVEHRIYLHLALGAVYCSAQDDGEALAEYAEAKRLLVAGVPVYTASLIAANVYAALGATHYHLSQFDYAGDYFFRCLEVREQLCGPDHVDTAAALNNLGATLFVLGKASDSMILFNRALAIATSQLTLTHPRRDTIETNLRIVKETFLTDATFPAVPFTPHTVPMIPGAQKARQFRTPKPKAAKPKDPPKKGK